MRSWYLSNQPAEAVEVNPMLANSGGRKADDGCASQH
jgi:hypothetical protein